MIYCKSNRDILVILDENINISCYCEAVSHQKKSNIILVLFCPLGYERVYDTPFHIQGDDMFPLGLSNHSGGGPRVVVSTAAFHARVRGSFPGLGGLKETEMFLPHPLVKLSIVGSLRDREIACSTSDRQGSNFESCVWWAVSSHSSHHPQAVLLAQFSLYLHKSGLKPDSFPFLSNRSSLITTLRIVCA